MSTFFELDHTQLQKQGFVLRTMKRLREDWGLKVQECFMVHELPEEGGHIEGRFVFPPSTKFGYRCYICIDARRFEVSPMNVAFEHRGEVKPFRIVGVDFDTKALYGATSLRAYEDGVLVWKGVGAHNGLGSREVEVVDLGLVRRQGESC